MTTVLQLLQTPIVLRQLRAPHLLGFDKIQILLQVRALIVHEFLQPLLSQISYHHSPLYWNFVCHIFNDLFFSAKDLTPRVYNGVNSDFIPRISR